MAWVEAPGRRPFARGRRLYVTAPKAISFPSEEPPEEHVPETQRHLEVRTTLYLVLRDALPDAAVGSDQFVYIDAGDPRRSLAPDVFVKLGARGTSFDNWKVWERGAPDVAVEIVSAFDRRDAEWDAKLERYQSSGIREVVRFDHEDEQPLTIWDRVDDELLERAPESSDLYACAALGLWWVIVPSDVGPMLRLARDRTGAQLLPTPSEDRMRLAGELAEERKARTIAEDEGKRGEDKLRAEAEARLAAERDRDAAQAELEQLRAELARARVPR
jgi:Uma2 family endonuclease